MQWHGFGEKRLVHDPQCLLRWMIVRYCGPTRGHVLIKDIVDCHFWDRLAVHTLCRTQDTNIQSVVLKILINS